LLTRSHIEPSFAVILSRATGIFWYCSHADKTTVINIIIKKHTGFIENIFSLVIRRLKVFIVAPFFEGLTIGCFAALREIKNRLQVYLQPENGNNFKNSIDSRTYPDHFMISFILQ